MAMQPTIPPAVTRSLVWLRRDLRIHDHAALSIALRSSRQVWCAFVFDRALLAPLPRRDRRVEFIHASVLDVDARLRTLALQRGVAGAGLLVRHGDAADEIVALATQLEVQAVHASHDDEPASLQRDALVRSRLADVGIAFHTCKDHVVFERSEVLTQLGRPFSVYTPYKNAWLARLGRDAQALQPQPVAAHAQALAAVPVAVARPLPSLAALGFEPTNLLALGIVPGAGGALARWQDFQTRLDDYDHARDYPAVKGPSYLSVHLRFGTVSVRELAMHAHGRSAAQGASSGADPGPDAGAGAASLPPPQGARVWLSELIWRDFYHQILHHHPHVVTQAFKPEWDHLSWEAGDGARDHFERWCSGRTGYPLVDAAMAQLNQTGYMHNRLRMLVASFLTKDLGVDWRWGEAYFAAQLNDFDLAANNGGWQWAASTGCDAQPYFRIFNPVTQSQKFDPRGSFIRRYLPALAALPDAAIHAPWLARPVDLQAAGVRLGHTYPTPIVDHAAARERTLERFRAGRLAFEALSPPSPDQAATKLRV